MARPDHTMADAQDGDVVRHPNYATVERTVLEHNEELIERYGAHHIGVSKKFRKGRQLPDTCITFYVMKKGAPARGQEIPKYLSLSYGPDSRPRSIATDVCEIGEEPTAFAMRGGNLVIAGDGETGTVGLVFRQGGADMFLTNAHVATDPGAPAGKVRVKVPPDGVFEGDVARLDDLTAPVIRSDAALVVVPDNSVDAGQFRGVPLMLESCGDVANNDPRRFFYVAADFVHEVRWRASIPAATRIRVDGRVLRYAGFHKFDVIMGQARRGDSGAVVFCQSSAGLTAVGLLFGGILSTNEIWAFPVRLCLRQMGIDPDSL